MSGSGRGAYVDGLGGYGTLRNLRILAASTSFRRTELVFPAMHSVLDVSYRYVRLHLTQSAMQDEGIGHDVDRDISLWLSRVRHLLDRCQAVMDDLNDAGKALKVRQMMTARKFRSSAVKTAGELDRYVFEFSHITRTAFAKWPMSSSAVQELVEDTMDYLVEMDNAGMQLGCLVGGLTAERKNQPCGYISA
jgi:hypothetical protein